MKMPVEKPKNFKGTFKRLLVYLKPFRFRLIVVVLLALLSTSFSILGPKIMGKATTEFYRGFLVKSGKIAGQGIDFSYILKIVLTLAVLYLVSAGFNYLMQFLMAGVAQKTVYNMRKDVNRKLTRLPLKYFDSRPHGEILSRITNDMDNISASLRQSLTQFITSAVTILGILVVMLSISPLYTLICVATLPLYFITAKIITGRSRKYFSRQQKVLGELNGHIEEMFSGHLIVKAFGYEKKSLDKFNEVNGEYYKAGWKAQFVSGVMMPLMRFINNIGFVLVCVAGGIFAIKRMIQVGDVQAFIQYARQFTHPIIQTANIANIIQSTIASAERVFEVLDEEEEPADSPEASGFDSVSGRIRFDGIRFGYSPDRILMEDLNIDVEPGHTVAIVGPTGAGKTTLVNLLMRFYEIDGGKITVDDKDIRTVKRGDLRSAFGMVLQDTWLFNGTIRDNIAYGSDNPDEEAVIAAAEAAHADHFIRTLPDGYDTVLNEDVSNLSQGQKQLLTIARAVLVDPPILILDEATSSVDTRTEQTIQNAMSFLMNGRTSFVIAHRLSTIREANLILVMNNGAIVEKGTHRELLAKNGFYADLYYSQFAGGQSGKKAV
jgi:ATP-binding cassette subfamily B protein